MHEWHDRGSEFIGRAAKKREFSLRKGRSVTRLLPVDKEWRRSMRLFAGRAQRFPKLPTRAFQPAHDRHGLAAFAHGAVRGTDEAEAAPARESRQENPKILWSTIA